MGCFHLAFSHLPLSSMEWGRGTFRASCPIQNNAFQKWAVLSVEVPLEPIFQTNATTCVVGQRRTQRLIAQTSYKQYQTSFPSKWLLRIVKVLAFLFLHPELGRIISIYRISLSCLLILPYVWRVLTFCVRGAWWKAFSQRSSLQQF